VKRVIDTNVPIVANGESSFSPSCVKRCTIFLKDFMSRGVLVIDNKWKILGEYKHKLKTQVGHPPKLGNAFLKWVLTNRENPFKVEKVRITPLENENRGFNEIPDDKDLERFDLSDRKFLAVSFSHNEKPPIVQGTDSKWIGFEDVLLKHGIKIEFLCKEELLSMYSKKILK